MCKINFEIKKPGPVSIRVVDILGKEIRLFANDYDNPGSYEVDFNDDSLIPGRYYYKIYDVKAEVLTGINGDDDKFLLQSGTLMLLNYYSNKDEIFYNL